LPLEFEQFEWSAQINSELRHVRASGAWHRNQVERAWFSFEQRTTQAILAKPLPDYWVHSRLQKAFHL
jgi:hypothetical protein